MRYVRIFEAKTCEHTGEFGWSPTWLSGVDEPYCGSGLISAHDALEHEADENDGDVENETRALGAAYFIRGETGFFGRDSRANPDPLFHIAGDFPELFRAFAHNGDKLGDVDEPHADPFGMLEAFEEIVDAGLKNTRDEYREEDEAGDLPEFAAARGWLVWLLIDGYTKACERFDGKGYRALELFDRVSDCTDSALDYARDAGEVGTLEIDIDTTAAKFSARFYVEENPTWGDDLTAPGE